MPGQASLAAGSGVTVLPSYLCEDDPASGTLVALLSPEDPPINCDCCGCPSVTTPTGS
ncbi:hypothetical protein GCM10010254_62770 [Streptomyces chromofuscus]|nr:hypothetical protein GCM10010254_62770 [Streptomyces chromofuscus]